MPGFVGFAGQAPPPRGQEMLEGMMATLVHEPSCRSGMTSVPELGFYLGWVARGDSEDGPRLMKTAGSDLALIFSGQHFAHDTALSAYEEHGSAAFEKLNGFFSGVLIDHRLGRAFLFNDRYGFDRVYISETDEGVFFASEGKALLEVLPRAREFDREGVADYLAFGCTIENRTLFRNVRLLPGGSVWTFTPGDCRKRRYFTPAGWEAQEPLGEEQFGREFERTFAEITPNSFAAKTKPGISLTAGIDSRIVLACAPPGAGGVCYTYEGPVGETLDSRLARQVAKACGYEHHLVRLESSFFTQFEEHAERTIYLTDGCAGPTLAHEIFFSQAARALAPVRVTGVFGGEILRGVSTFKPIHLSPGLLDNSLGQSVARRVSEFRASTNAVTAAAFQEIPWNIFGSVAACRTQLDFRTPYLDNAVVALAYRTPAHLRASAAPAVRMIERKAPQLARIPTDMGLFAGASQRAWAKATFKLEYLCNDGMPGWLGRFEPLINSLPLVGRHKYLRYRRWFRRELADYVRDSLGAEAVRHSSLWTPAFIRTLADAHIRGRANHVSEINAVLTLSAVERLLLKSQRGTGVARMLQTNAA